MQNIDVLIVEDEEQLAHIHAAIARKNPRVRAVNHAATLASARTLVRALRPDLVLLDNYLPDGKGIALLEDLVSADLPARVIFITAATDMETCARAIRHGAFDYIVKPVSYERLQMSLERFVSLFNSQQASTRINQHQVDELFNLQAKDFRVEKYAKGIEPITLERVRQAFALPEGLHTADSVARAVGISKTTARRYLEFCVENRFLRAEISYGHVGRPQRMYVRAAA
ncbi:Transcriptional regulatory protein DpiA [Caballeronia sp. SBC1]|uniref:response regulator n=1 Tax=Caballeronia sp. SBC1 TaxID=2705548 RepID=UPI0013E1F061|nr:response regulator [Caballeronia sp. SBC1]QIE25446.1 Transcriptional regulatory protein DpiA [Caballeronia sp. SBC2]QIN63496.1 Transcriptional regulatory protein DpiA [Caballeronia sp. SBC1]